MADIRAHSKVRFGVARVASRTRCAISSIPRSGPNTESPAPARHRKLRALPLGLYPQELPRHRIDPNEICRDLLIAAAFTGDRMETAARERLGRACAAKMDYRGK